MLCITMEVETRTGKQCKCHCCCVCKNDRGKVMEDGFFFFFASFFAYHKWQICGKMHFSGILLHEQKVIACCQTHSDYRPSKMLLKLAL